MLDFGNVPVSTSDIQIFTSPSTVTNTQWQTWRKPRGKSMWSAMCIGGGGGGGGGFTAAAAAARGGGGGGACSGVSKYMGPLAFVPDILYIQVGAGGAGGAAGAAGSAGVNSFVSVYPDSAATNVIIAANTNLPGGGGGGTGAAAGTGGTVPTVAAAANEPLGGMGMWDSVTGIVGSAGGAQTGAIGVASVIPVTRCLTMPGAGGAGVTAADFAGGVITAITSSYLSQIRPQGAAAGSNNGSGGFLSWRPFFSFCGLGGSSSNAGVGGFGGNAGPGSGGGGGGGGTTGGSGGKGGDGIVIIICW